MRIFIAAIAFGVTIGGLFLFENYKAQPKEKNYAQIVQNLQNQVPTEILTPKPVNKLSKTAARTPAPSPVFSSLLSPAPTATQSPILSTPLSAPSLTPTVTSFAEPAQTTTPTPTPQPSQQNDQITVVSLTSPVKQNESAQLDIKTILQAQCTIKVTLPSGSQSSAKGLEDKTTDSSGAITWSWKVNWNTTPGTANIELVCSKDGQSFTKTLQMIIIER